MSLLRKVSESRRFKSGAVWLAAALLLVQNLAIFWRHYFGNVGFPWDFPREYYAVVVFWTRAVQEGIFPAWAPFASMGLPFALHLQAGLYYPPLWIFPLLKIPYTLNAAVAFECLHVFLGALGAYVFFKDRLGKARYALIGAVIFQFFGGFYSNAEHVDIVRAFALTPWLLYVFSLPSGEDSQGLAPGRRLLLAPLFVFAFITGSYPGNYLAGLFLLAVYVLVQGWIGYRREKALRPALVTLGKVGAAALLGVGMAAVYLGPVATSRDQIVRYSFYQDLDKFNFELRYLPSLIFSNVNLPGEVSMNSIFITLPAFIFLFFFTRQDVRAHLAEISLLALAGVLAFGSQTFVWTAVTRVLFPLQISRFPSSDYRAFAALLLVLFALLGLRRAASGEFSLWQLAVRLLVCGLAAAQLYYMTYKLGRGEVTNALMTLAMCGLAILAFRYAQGNWQALLLGVVVLATYYNGWQTLQAMKKVWIQKDIASFYEEKVSEEVGAVLADPPQSRPARQTAKLAFTGYLTGNYMLGPACLVRTCSQVEKDPALQQYMAQAWTPLLLEKPDKVNPAKGVRVDPARLAVAAQPADGGVQQARYGANEIWYDIDLDHETLLVENELYFPGWQADIPEQQAHLQAVAVNQALRGWVLPAGQYRLKAYFVFPNWTLFLALSGVSLALWLGWLAFATGRALRANTRRLAAAANGENYARN